MQNKRIIYSRKIMLKLIDMGIYPVETIKNPYQPQYWCWVYENCKELQDALDVVFGKERGVSYDGR